MQNERMSRRLQVNFPAFIDLDGEVFEGSVREIGDGGIRLECARDIKPSQTGMFGLSASVDAETLWLKGEVLYKYPAAQGSRLFQYGIRFVEMDAEGKDALASLLRLITIRGRYAPKRSGIIGED